MLKTRVITALVLLVAFLAALFGLPQSAWAVFAAILVLPAAWEWGKLAKLAPGSCASYVAAVVAACGSLYVLALQNDSPGAFGLASTIYLAASLFWVLIVPVWLWRAGLSGAGWVSALTGLLVLVATWLALVQLRLLSPLSLLLLMAVAWISDTAAYFAGHRFGRRKLAPAISPGKTWEGVAGAALAVSVYAVLWNLVWPGNLPRAFQSMRFGAWAMLVFLWLLMAAGIYGDLFESALKRRAGVKDSGTLLPGHGGVLDRIDALTAVLPVAALAYLL
jgi:phosphatidate cytidylyltransferase